MITVVLVLLFTTIATIINRK